MRSKRYFVGKVVLFGGDAVTLLLVTILGFASHSRLDASPARLLATFIPLVLAWLLIAPFTGAFTLVRAVDVRSLGRIAWGMIFAVPFATMLRGLWLSVPIQPLFVVILDFVCVVFMLVWRWVCCQLLSRWKRLSD